MTADPSQGQSRLRLLAPYLLIYLVHLGLVAYACPWSVMFGGEPVMGVDYQTHFEQARAVAEAISRWGHTWAYDPNLLAGQPAGLIFDVDNKAHGLFTFALTRLGLNQAVAFNLFVLLSHLLAPLAVLLSARLLRSGGRAATISFGLAVLLWHFDSAARWYWWAGMISFATASWGSLVVIALFHRLMEGGPARRFLSPLLLLLPLVLLTHVWAFAILVVPLCGLYLRAARARKLGPAGHAQVWGLALFALAANLFWLWPALTHAHLIAPSGRGGQASPLNLLTDYLNLYIDGLVTGTLGIRTLWRFAALCGAVLTLRTWRRQGDARLFTMGLALAWCWGIAYLLALIPGLRETEPHRFVFPASLLAAVAAGPWFATALSRGWIRQLSPVARAVLVVLLVLLAPRVVRSVLDYMPELGPGVRAPQPSRDNPTELTPVSQSFNLRHDAIPKTYRQVAKYLREECKESGRVLVWWWVMGEYLRWATNRPIIGGFPDRRLVHEAANVFRYLPDRRLRGRELANYLVRYNIRYVVISSALRIPMERHGKLLELVKVWPLGGPRIYRVRHRASYFAAGSGEIRARINRIEVRRARPDPAGPFVVLRYHYMDELRCRPGCRLERVKLPFDPVGFIKVVGVPTLPRAFVIENGY